MANDSSKDGLAPDGVASSDGLTAYEQRERRAPSARELSLRSELLHVRHELRSLLADLERLAEQPSVPIQSAVVTAVVSRTVLIHPPRRS